MAAVEGPAVDGVVPRRRRGIRQEEMDVMMNAINRAASAGAREAMASVSQYTAEAINSSRACAQSWNRLNSEVNLTHEKLHNLTKTGELLAPILLSTLFVGVLSFVCTSTLLWTLGTSGVISTSVACFSRIMAWLCLISSASIIGAILFYFWVNDQKQR